MCTAQGFENTFARVEKKFVLDPEQAERVIRALDSHGFRENIFGSPLIQSIYYDTPDFMLTRRSVERPNYKEKLRLRTYGHPDGASPAFVEIKKKLNGIVYKRRTSLPLGQALDAVARDRFLPENGQIGREIEWFIRSYPGLRPAVLIAYERRAFENPREGLRLTFDANVRFRDRDFDLTRPAEGTRLLPHGGILMEVKVPGAYPLWLADLIWEVGAVPTHFSKVGAAYTDFILPRRREAVRARVRERSKQQEVLYSA